METSTPGTISKLVVVEDKWSVEEREANRWWIFRKLDIPLTSMVEE